MSVNTKGAKVNKKLYRNNKRISWLYNNCVRVDTLGFYASMYIEIYNKREATTYKIVKVEKEAWHKLANRGYSYR